MKKKILFALVLSASMLFSVNVSALGIFDDPKPEVVEEINEEVVVKEIEPLELDGMTRIVVTTSDSTIAGSTEKVATENFFDGKSSTGCTIIFEDSEAVEEDGELADCEVSTPKTFSIYTATRVPEAVESIAALFDGEKGTVLAINVYATNDSLLLDWKQLTLENPLYTDGNYDIINIANYPQKYSFYRIDITVEEGTYFTLSELLLYKDASDDSYYYYAHVEELEPGETPELIEVKKPRTTVFSNFINKVLRPATSSSCPK